MENSNLIKDKTIISYLRYKTTTNNKPKKKIEIIIIIVNTSKSDNLETYSSYIVVGQIITGKGIPKIHMKDLLKIV